MAKTIDWEAIERDWRANIKTKQQIGTEYSVSRAAMDKRFAKLGVERDLGAKIRAKAEALVTQQAVTQEVTQQGRVTEAETINANASIQASIMVSHRTDIQRARKLTMGLLAELEGQTDNIELFHTLSEIMAAPDEKGQDKRRDLFDKVISLNSRSGTMKTLADSLKTLVALEREAFGIDGAKSEESETDKLIRMINNKYDTAGA